MSDTYYKHVKKTQPHGPYALTGYSLRTTVAFELAKRLEANNDTVAFCAALDVSHPEQRATLNLDTERLLAIVNVTVNFSSIAKTCHSRGQLGKIAVFFCTPLHSVERDRERWVKGQLSEWSDFSLAEVEFRERERDHADMLDPTYMEGFEKRLNKVLKARGI